MFKNDYSFRRFTVILTLGLTAWVTSQSVSYALMALASSADWAGTVAVIGAIQAPVIGLAGYVFKLYNSARNQKE